MASRPEFFEKPPISTTGQTQMVDENVPQEWADLDQSTRMRASEFKANIEYILDPHVPAEYKKEFAKYEMLMSRNLALAQLPDWNWVFRYLDIFDTVVLYIKMDHIEIAIKRMGRMIMELQLSRSVGGFERTMQVSTRQVIEQPNLEAAKKKKKGILPFG